MSSTRIYKFYSRHLLFTSDFAVLNVTVHIGNMSTETSTIPEAAVLSARDKSMQLFQAGKIFQMPISPQNDVRLCGL